MIASHILLVLPSVLVVGVVVTAAEVDPAVVITTEPSAPVAFAGAAVSKRVAAETVRDRGDPAVGSQDVWASAPAGWIPVEATAVGLVVEVAGTLVHYPIDHPGMTTAVVADLNEHADGTAAAVQAWPLSTDTRNVPVAWSSLELPWKMEYAGNVNY